MEKYENVSRRKTEPETEKRRSKSKILSAFGFMNEMYLDEAVTFFTPVYGSFVYRALLKRCTRKNMVFTERFAVSGEVYFLTFHMK